MINEVLELDEKLAPDVPERSQKIASELGLTKDAVDECFAIKESCLSCGSLNVHTEDGSKIGLKDSIIDDSSDWVEDIVMKKALREKLECLMAERVDPCDREILMLWLGWDDDNQMSIEKIADKYGISRWEAYSAKRRAIARLQNSVSRKQLKDFDDFPAHSRASYYAELRRAKGKKVPKWIHVCREVYGRKVEEPDSFETPSFEFYELCDEGWHDEENVTNTRDRDNKWGKKGVHLFSVEHTVIYVAEDEVEQDILDDTGYGSVDDIKRERPDIWANALLHTIYFGFKLDRLGRFRFDVNNINDVDGLPYMTRRDANMFIKQLMSK